MKKLTLLIVISLFFPPLAFAQQTLSLTTYYPSPFGVYNQMRLVPTAAGFNPCNVNNNGLLWIDNVGILRMCWGGAPIGAPGIWSQTAGAIFPSDLLLAVPVDRNVGIGTTTPGTKLHVVGSGILANIARVRIASTDNQAGVSFLSNNTGEAIVYSPTGTDDIRMFVGGADRISVLSTGNVGIGTTAPGNTLDVVHPVGGVNNVIRTNGRIHTNSVAGGILINDLGTQFFGTLNATTAGIWMAGLWRFLVTDAGNVGINAIPTARLHVVGGAGAAQVITATTGFVGDSLEYRNDGTLRLLGGDMYADAFFYNSDITLKENIKPVSGLEKILQLQGIQFNWKKSGQTDVGLSAQNVEEVFPDLVSTDPTTNLKSVKYGNLVAPLIEAIKEQQNQIELLKKEIDELKARQF